MNRDVVNALCDLNYLAPTGETIDVDLAIVAERIMQQIRDKNSIEAMKYSVRDIDMALWAYSRSEGT